MTTFTAAEAGTLLDLLCQQLHPMTRTRLRKLLRHGAVLVDGVIITRDVAAIEAGQTIEIQKANRTRQTRRPAPAPILYEDGDVIAVNKPGGLLSIATQNERHRTLYKSLQHYVQTQSQGRERIFIVHRLDREVSGIMLFAKSETIQETLQRAWKAVEKRYLALVEGHPEEERGTIRTWLRENRAHLVYVCEASPHAKLAVTHYRQINALPKNTLLEIRIETGRKHQIRVHLASIGCPIVGDRRYGAKQGPIRRIGLCANALAFDHPITKRRIELEIPTPQAMRMFRSAET